MMDLDEDLLRDLMQRGTSDVRASQPLAHTIVVSERRRHRRNYAAGAALTGVAVAVAFGTAAVSSEDQPSATGSPGTSASGTSAAPVELTAAQRTLFALSDQAATAPAAEGRYAVLNEDRPGAKRTSVIDSQTGDTWTYQQATSDVYTPSELPVAPHFSPTAAEFAAMPTDPTALRALLLADAKAERDKAFAEIRAMGDTPQGPFLTDDDMVFQAATNQLWNPLVPPALRSALFKVLAATPGVTVDDNTQDSSGRPAIAMSRVDSTSVGPDAGRPQTTITNYMDASTSAVLEQRNTYAAYEGQPGSVSSEFYQSVTWSDTLPANPYQG